MNVDGEKPVTSDKPTAVVPDPDSTGKGSSSGLPTRPKAMNRWVLPLALVGPNQTAAVLILGGPLLECFALRFVPESILTLPGPSQVQIPATLLLIWFHGIWGLWAVSQFLRWSSEQGWHRMSVVMTVLLQGAVILAASVCIASWSMYFRTGRFGDSESLQFFIRNLTGTVLVNYLWRSEKSLVIAAGLMTLLAIASIVPVFRRLQQGRWGRLPISPIQTHIARTFVWLLIVLAVTTTQAARKNLNSLVLKRTWQDACVNRLHPMITLVITTSRTIFGEPILPVLNSNELIALGKTDWNHQPLGHDAPSVIFLAIESLRHDVVGLVHQGREVMPNLSQLARDGVQFTRAYSQSTHSDYSDVCIVSSLYPLRMPGHHYYKKTDPWPKRLIYDLLKPEGFRTAIVSSQNEKWGAMDNFLDSPNLDLFYDAERSQAPTRLNRSDSGFAREIAAGTLRSGKLDDAHTTDRALDWIRERRARNERFFIAISLQNSHFPYDMAPATPRPFSPHEIDFDASFVNYPAEKVPVVRNAYYNAVHACDRQLGRIVESLREQGLLENTILVVMGENGEAFHESGVVTHAGPPVEPCVHVALVMHSPARLTPRVDDYPTELVDVVPTVFGLLGLPKHPNFQGSDVLSSQRVPLDERLLFFHTETGICRSDALLFQDRWKLIHEREMNVFRLHDLALDSTESRDISEANPELARELRDVLHSWRSRQLAYYHYPQYYLSAYPPQPPRASAALVHAAAAARLKSGARNE